MPKFVMTDKHLYWWPVTVRVPDPDNAGTFAEQSFEMQFEAQPREVLLACQERHAAATTDRERIEADKEQMRMRRSQLRRIWRLPRSSKPQRRSPSPRRPRTGSSPACALASATWRRTVR